jgi:glutamate synthase domain-containing protein 1
MVTSAIADGRIVRLSAMGRGKERHYNRCPMCGIAGLFSKSPSAGERLGEHLGAMLGQLNDRGPDSAGVAFYRDPAPAGMSKVSLFSEDPDQDWGAVGADLARAFGGDPRPEVRASHAVFVIDADAERAQAWLRERHPRLRIMSAGQTIEIYKEAGLPSGFVEPFALGDLQGSHALGHTRMATESRVTTQHSHPFSTGLDLCLVHNGSLSNHNRLRMRLRREGIAFQTDNDTEVAAGYLTWRMREGAGLEEALDGCLRDLDGFYTFAVGTADGFAVLRDPIACKPAVLAETDDWVAMASEYRAIAVLPGAEDATLWEPEPGQIYLWERALV